MESRRLGDTADCGRRVGGQVDIRAAARQTGENARFRIERRLLDLGRPGQRREHYLTRFRRPSRGIGDSGPLPLERSGRSRPDIVNRQRMACRNQAAGDRRSHRPGADKTDTHRPSSPVAAAIIDATSQRGKRRRGSAEPIRRRRSRSRRR